MANAVPIPLLAFEIADAMAEAGAIGWYRTHFGARRPSWYCRAEGPALPTGELPAFVGLVHYQDGPHDAWMETRTKRLHTGPRALIGALRDLMADVTPPALLG